MPGGSRSSSAWPPAPRPGRRPRAGRGRGPAAAAGRAAACCLRLAGAILGWAIPIWALALDGQPVGATARAIAALAGLPPYAGVTVAVVLLLAALQVLVGAWLARGVIPGRR